MKVGLYIPCFNAEETIQSCLEAVFKQIYPIKEVVVVDDGSTDRTIEIVSKYPVKIIRHTHNKGLAFARNTAIKNINTEFIASLDADCQPEPDWLSHLIKRFDSPNIAGVGGRLLEAYSSSVFDLWRSVHMKQYWDNEKMTPPFLFGSNTVFNKEMLLKIGLYDETFKSNYEDVDISNRLKKKGWLLIYEPKAIVRHFKNDDICSLLDTFWRWNLGYHQKEGYYSNQENFIFKLKDNLGLANRFIEEDIASKKYQLLYLDFLLCLHHSLRDFAYFISPDNKENLDNLNYPILLHWLTLLDLTFFYHLDSAKNNLSTLIPKADTFLQNFFALDLILGRLIQGKFKSNKFKKILYKHLFLSLYKISDTHLLDNLLNLIELHQDWSGLFKKRHPNLDTSFLEILFSSCQKWLEDLISHFPEIIKTIEVSAEKTDEIFNYEVTPPSYVT